MPFVYRVGMLPRKATLENILAERQLELAWEGLEEAGFGAFWKVLPAPYTDRPQLPMNRMAIPLFSPFPIKSVP